MKKLIKKILSDKKELLFKFFLILFIILIAFIKYPREDICYDGANATWHTLLTMKAYSEHPISVHKFLPIVNLGGDNNKWITWGETIPDKYGNYYYTSFSAMGFVLPYIFVRLFHLPYTELSLYIFNTILLCISSLVIYNLFKEIFSKKKNYLLFSLILGAYILAPEIMHGMGLVYWSQSLMQIFIPLQLLYYYRYIKYNRKKDFIGVLIMCLINPYTEWTGFVVNGGIFLSELFLNKSKGLKEKIKSSSLIVLTTIMSFLIFCGHYLLCVDSKVFFEVLSKRFLVRSIKNKIPISKLFYGYFESCGSLIILVLIFSLLFLFNKKRIKRKFKTISVAGRAILFISLFSLLENIIMKQHAIEYTYDRMKLALPLMIILYWLIINNDIFAKKKLKFIIIPFCIIIMIPAIIYKTTDKYYWPIDYEVGNKEIANYIKQTYNEDNSIMGFNWTVRGYINLLFNRGCYELVYDYKTLYEIASNQNKRYIIYLKKENEVLGVWDKYYLSAIIYDRETETKQTISNFGNEIWISSWHDN